MAENQEICSAAALSAKLAFELDWRADYATEEDHQSGQYGSWRHDATALRRVQKIFEREQQPNMEVSDSANAGESTNET